MLSSKLVGTSKRQRVLGFSSFMIASNRPRIVHGLRRLPPSSVHQNQHTDQIHTPTEKCVRSLHVEEQLPSNKLLQNRAASRTQRPRNTSRAPTSGDAAPPRLKSNDAHAFLKQSTLLHLAESNFSRRRLFAH